MSAPPKNPLVGVGGLALVITGMFAGAIAFASFTIGGMVGSAPFGICGWVLCALQEVKLRPTRQDIVVVLIPLCAVSHACASMGAAMLVMDNIAPPYSFAIFAGTLLASTGVMYLSVRITRRRNLVS